MITLLVGEDSFEIERELRRIIDDFEGEVEKLDVSALRAAGLAEALTCVSLFSTSRLIIARGLSENSECWNKVCDYIPNMADGVDLVLIETKPDKRTITFKKIKEAAKVKEFTPWTDRDIAKAVTWVTTEAKAAGIDMDKKSVQALVNRVGIDQWQLSSTLQKLSVLDGITPEVIEDVIEANPTENVFNLLELSLSGDVVKLKKTIAILEKTEDVYRLTSLLISQVFQLAVASSATPDDNVAKDFGIHPYVLSRLKMLSKKLGKSGVANLVNIFSELDEATKTSSAEPWFLIERALIKVSNN